MSNPFEVPEGVALGYDEQNPMPLSEESMLIIVEIIENKHGEHEISRILVPKGMEEVIQATVLFTEAEHRAAENILEGYVEVELVQLVENTEQEEDNDRRII